MITEKDVLQHTEAFLTGTPLFITDLMIKPINKIAVFLDGDHGVTIEDCQKLSRHLEEQLDREKEDFDLTVSSAGADKPLKLPRQYAKNLGRFLEITTLSGDKITAKVMKADNQGITISYTEKKAKKQAAEIVVSLQYADIKSAKEVITFKK